jgi:NADPH:quinone reductase-like Zn-dependent oxidoreductase
MQRAEYSQRGPVPQDVIACVERDTPTPGPGEVLLELLAAPINPSDVLTLTGQYGALPPLPAVGGNEGVGRVVALGEGVTGVAIGERALMPIGGGTWTSHIVTPAATLLRMPSAGDPQQLAMLAVNPPTAMLLLSEFVTLEPGAWVIQNAANSGVGEYLVQLAKRRGVRTVSVVRREEAVAPLRALGGDVVLVDGPDLAKRVAAATGKAPVLLGIDAVGGTATERIAQSVEPCVISPGSFVFRDVTLKGFWLTQWFMRAPASERQRVYAELAGLIVTGALHARVHATFPLSQVREAVALAARGGRHGKVLLTP